MHIQAPVLIHIVREKDGWLLFDLNLFGFSSAYLFVKLS